MKPSVGRIIHYVSYGTPNGEYDSVCRAAVVTEVVGDDYISIAVLNPTGLFFKEKLHKGIGLSEPGTWHWPEREE